MRKLQNCVRKSAQGMQEGGKIGYGRLPRRSSYMFVFLTLAHSNILMLSLDDNTIRAYNDPKAEQSCV